MQIDRRITNGLAWAGAVLVVAIPAADFAMRQLGPSVEAPQVAVVQAEPVEQAVALPTPAVQRPAAIQAPQNELAEVEVANAPAADPVITSASRPTNGTAVDKFIENGRELPSYISGAGNAAAAAPTRPSTPAAPAAPKPTPAPAVAAVPAVPAAPTPAVTTPKPVTAAPATAVAAVPPKPVAFPTPVSQRPPSVAQSTVRPLIVPQQQPPLIVDEAPPVLTADDLDDWESGPLSEFLASRGNRSQAAPAVEPEYDSNGFFLDEAPGRTIVQPLPRAYGEGFYYPFAD
ncbi:hypothetical protein [Devosia rhizoryzae]|uniref:Uncharacterized protein n=1 Tax=Devosia rhizoryzae TaxID=2774137 RepID=A0ABX7CBN0_9HYPH|nr:hypothetical protein [Devosia rhizoryzae]QQR40167.1 hypothetical protein JI748_03900 [Devosia rhizoryzae]